MDKFFQKRTRKTLGAFAITKELWSQLEQTSLYQQSTTYTEFMRAVLREWLVFTKSREESQD